MDMKAKLDSLPQVKIKVSEREYLLDYGELEIARETIDENMIEQASLYAYYAVLESMLKEVVGDKKLELEIMVARLFAEYKGKDLKAGGKGTDRSADSQVRQDEKYIAAVLAFNEAEKNHGIFKAIAKAFEHRREMLINLGAKFRKEMEGDVSTRLRKREFEDEIR